MRERKREKAPIWRFTPQMPAMTGAKLVRGNVIQVSHVSGSIPVTKLSLLPTTICISGKLVSGVGVRN